MGIVSFTKCTPRWTNKEVLVRLCPVAKDITNVYRFGIRGRLGSSYRVVNRSQQIKMKIDVN